MSTAQSGGGGVGISIAISCCIVVIVVTICLLYYYRCEVFDSGCDECKWTLFVESGCPEDSPSTDSTEADTSVAGTPGPSTSPTPPPGSGSPPPPGGTPTRPPPSGTANINGHVFPIVRTKYTVGKGYIWNNENLGKAPFTVTDAAECERNCTEATDNTWCEHWGFKVDTKLCYLTNNKADETAHIRGIKKAKLPMNIDSARPAELGASVDPADCMQKCEASEPCGAWFHRDSKHATQPNTCVVFPSGSASTQIYQGFSANEPWVDSPWSHDTAKYTTINNFHYNPGRSDLANFNNQRDAETWSDAHPECSGYVYDDANKTYWCKGSIEITSAQNSTSTSYIKKSRTTFTSSNSTPVVYFRIRNERTGFYLHDAGQNVPLGLVNSNPTSDAQKFSYNASTKEIVPKSNIAYSLSVDQGNTNGGSIVLFLRGRTDDNSKFTYDETNLQIISVKDSNKIIYANTSAPITTNCGGTKNNNDVTSGYRWNTDNVFFIEPVL